MNSSYSNPVTLRALFIATLLAGAVTANAQWKPGSTLPDLKPFNLQGELPSTLKGKVVFVDFWASWCSPCKASFPTLNALHKKYASAGLVILAVNVDDKEAAMKTFLTENPATFTVVRDAGKKLVANAAVESMPSSFLIDRSGKIRYVHTGFHGEKTAELYTREIELLLKEEARP